MKFQPDGSYKNSLFYTGFCCKRQMTEMLCFAWIDTLFSTRILDDSSEHFIQSEFLYSNLVICCST